MNREIKYRAWDKGNEIMIYAEERHGGSDYYFDFVGNSFKLLMPREDDYPYEVDCVIMQCLGIKDKNGKEFYEGDVVMYMGERCTVYYDESSASFRFGAGWTFQYPHKLEIIGNIYESAEEN